MTQTEKLQGQTFEELSKAVHAQNPISSQAGAGPQNWGQLGYKAVT